MPASFFISRGTALPNPMETGAKPASMNRRKCAGTSVILRRIGLPVSGDVNAKEGHSAGRGTTYRLKPNKIGVMRSFVRRKRPAGEGRKFRVRVADPPVEDAAAVTEDCVEKRVGHPPVDSGKRQIRKARRGEFGGRREHREHLRGKIRNAEEFGDLVPGLGEKERMHDGIRPRGDGAQALVNGGRQRKNKPRHHRDHPQRVDARFCTMAADSRSGSPGREMYSMPVFAARPAYVSGAARRTL